jgi:hypothetical protein
MTGARFVSCAGACPSRRGRTALGGLTLLCLALVSCGGSSHPAARIPAPQRVCSRAERAVRAGLGPVVLQIADSDPANIECVLRGQGIRVDAVAQAATQAWTEYDTTVVHQVQAWAGDAHAKGEIPQEVSIRGAQASWIPAESELVATNGTESTAGSYVTVTVTGHQVAGVPKASLAQTVGAAVLTVAPRGSNPGAPPS